MLASIFGMAARPLSTPEQVEKVVSDISNFMDEQSFNTAVAVFSSLRPPDQADVMAKLRRIDQVKLLSWLTPKRFGMIVEELEPDDVIEISKDLDVNHLSQVLDEINPAVAADVLRELPYEARTETLSSMKEVQDVLPLIDYEDDDAGGLMTPEFVSLSENMTVSQAMDFVRRSSSTIDINEVSFILVVDDGNILKGGLNVSRLVTSDPSELISEVMFPNVISVSAGTDQEECALIMEKYNLLTLPVTDSAGRLEGIVKIEDMIYVFQEEATEDMYRMVGVSDEEKILGPFWKSVR
ncbi:MAG: CBS domain-containing protein, partial [Dehalococcoidia bacterium]|nr:CBS domain-containing protein [Dehalococcoidia bacterium]